MKIFKLIIVCILLIQSAAAQQQLSLQDAINTAIDKNYAVQISKNNVEIIENLANKGQAGLLPIVSATGTVDYTNNNTKLQIVNAPDITEIDGAESFATRATVKAVYTVFSGGVNSNNFDKLVLNAGVSNAVGNLEVETIVMQVISSFYNVLRTKNNLKALQETKKISTERLQKAEKRKQLSGGTKTELFSSQVDFNKDSVNMMNASLAYQSAQISLNQLLGVELSQEFNYQSSNLVNSIPPYEELKTNLDKMNSSLISARLKEQASMLDYKIAKSAYSPRLDLNASYAYSRSEAEGSILVFNQNTGPGIGLSLSIPIYSGGKKSNAVKNAQIQLKNSELQVKNNLQYLNASLLIAFHDYTNSKSLVELETKNFTINKENFEYSKKLHDLGQITGIEFRQAQINLMLNQNSLNNLTYNLKLSELEILRLTGSLLSDNK
tara:strand:+ start:4874 stop:6187 length:1314 start_codon:yes stop_codon:yes gene_type:complete